MVLPNTAYYLPFILGMTGQPVEKLGDLGELDLFARVDMSDRSNQIPAGDAASE